MWGVLAPKPHPRRKKIFAVARRFFFVLTFVFDLTKESHALEGPGMCPNRFLAGGMVFPARIALPYQRERERESCKGGL